MKSENTKQYYTAVPVILSASLPLFFSILLRVFAVHDVHAEPLLAEFGVAAVLDHLRQDVVRQLQERTAPLGASEGIGVDLGKNRILEVDSFNYEIGRASCRERV